MRSQHVGVRHAGFKDVGVDVATLTELNRRMQSSRRHHISRGGQHLDGGVPAQRAGCGSDRCRPVDGRDRRSRTPCRSSPDRASSTSRSLGGPRDIRRGWAAMRPWSSGNAESSTAADAAASTSLRIGPRRPTRSIWCVPPAAAPRGYLVVAGSVSTSEQIEDLRAAGADAFTIGSAIFDGVVLTEEGQHHVATA